MMIFLFFIFLFFFFFKQKTAYESRLSLVGSEMCIRDSRNTTNAPITCTAVIQTGRACRRGWADVLTPPRYPGARTDEFWPPRWSIHPTGGAGAWVPWRREHVSPASSTGTPGLDHR